MKLTRGSFTSNVMIIFLTAAILVLSAGCVSGNIAGNTAGKTIVFADADWDSIKFHNRVAALILEKGYGYETDTKSGSTAITFTGLRKGDIDVYMETWSDNLEFYDEAIESGDVVELSVNFDDNAQGLYVPTYLIKGDAERGIKAAAPDLRTVRDLEKYKNLFKDPEEPDKGRLYGSIAGWEADNFLYKKYKAYGLDKQYNYMRPGSENALSASIAAAFEKGEPWVGYYWEPTWVMGKYDMTLLKDEPYSADKWENGTCEFPAVKVTVCVNKDLEKNAPDAVEFLRSYKTGSAVTSEALAYMMKNNASHEDTAKWFLLKKQDLWKAWVPEEIARKVEAALN